MVEHSVRDAGAAGSSPVVPIFFPSTMKIINKRVFINTKGNGDFLDITREIAGRVEESELQTGSAPVIGHLIA